VKEVATSLVGVRAGDRGPDLASPRHCRATGEMGEMAQ
jgi:hypothetical protein